MGESHKAAWNDLSNEVARRALKRLLGIAADHGAMQYISAFRRGGISEYDKSGAITGNEL